MWYWRRKWQPTPVFLLGESQGQGSLVGWRLWGRTESDTTEWLTHSNFTNCPNDDLYWKRKSWITSCIQLLHVFNLGRFFDFTLSFTTLTFFINTGQSVTLQTIPPVCVMRFWREYYISNAEFLSVHLFGELLVTTHSTTGDITFLITWLRWCLPGLSSVRHSVSMS